MPVRPENVGDLNYDLRDLFLDVRLTSIGINDTIERDDETGFVTNLDFTGRPTFKTEFFRESTGFGITNIKVSTNASLQPTLDIEFKDLYGKTVFGELSGVQNERNSYKALFQWPPPKFEFTFKGYLGKPVTWILNMKTTSTQYNSDDGSYTLKATFIPNQWGMFADIPFLYLFAVKGLKSQFLGEKVRKTDPSYKEKTESIIDLMYIGKKLETTKKLVSKDYDSIVGNLQALKSDPVNGILTGRIPVASLSPEGEEPELIKSGIPGNSGIAGFKPLALILPEEYKDKSKEEIILYLNLLPTQARASENARIKAATFRGGDFATQNPLQNSAGKYVKVEGKFGSGEINKKVKTDAKDLDGTIEANLQLIDTQIKATLYGNNTEELKKTTISEIFSRIAKDTAYIMGFIIDAGEQGYFNNKTDRQDKEKKNEIIGQYFPMEFREVKNKNENDPNPNVKKQFPADGLGTDDFEKLFVSNFITAISFGIAQNKSLQAAAGDESQNAIKFRVNNIEIISDNPFLNISDWREMASIIMKRAGVAAYLTRNQDPNRPGYYPNEWFFTLSPEKMRQMADNDLSNITDAILLQLEPEDLEQLKTFANFWINLIQDADGVTNGGGITFNVAKWRGGNATLSGDRYAFSINKLVYVKNPGNPELTEDAEVKSLIEQMTKEDGDWNIDKRILKNSNSVLGAQPLSVGLMKNLGIIDAKKNSFNRENTKYTELAGTGFKGWTVEDYLEQFIGPNYLFHGRSTKQGYDGVKVQEPTLKASSTFFDTLTPFVHFNGLNFAHESEKREEEFEFLWFRDSEDVTKISELQPVQGTSDSDDANLEEEEKNENETDGYPLGVSIIDSPTYLLEPNEQENEVVGFFILETNKQPAPGIQFYRKSGKLGYGMLDYGWCKGANTLTDVIGATTESSKNTYEGKESVKVTYISRDNLRNNLKPSWFPTDDKTTTYTKAEYPFLAESVTAINPEANPMAYVVYAQNKDGGGPGPAMSLFGSSVPGIAARAFLRKYCVGLIGRIQDVQDEVNEVFGQILGRAGEHEDLLYQQFHSLFHQWQILGSINNKRINSSEIKALEPKVANELEEIYGAISDDSGAGCGESIAENGNEVVNFRYDFPLQSNNEDAINVADSIINIAPLYNAKANTTVLNIFQQTCTKNNFMFFPIPGNSRYKCVEDIFRPVTHVRSAKIGNFFQILFNPTPESRSLNVDSDEAKSLKDDPKDFTVDAFPVKFGDPTNKIIRNVTVGTDDNKVTAESIVNLQKIVDDEDNSRSVTTDCSLLSVFEGRSYKAKVETIGNAQISPMQFFYLENHTIFTGLYQITKVDHSISPNNMTTEFEGIKMRYAAGSYGGIFPITLKDLEDAFSGTKSAPLESVQETEEEAKRREEALNFTGKSYSASASNIVGTDEGSKAVAKFLKNPTTKRNIDDLITRAVKDGITDPKTIAGILSIISKESSFVAKFENLYYSLERAYEVWPRLKKVDTSKAFNPSTNKADTESYRKELCKLVYGKTYGNDGYTSKPGKSDHAIKDKFVGPYEDGFDGYRYRGGGYNQITFKSAYIKAKESSGVDVVTNPELIVKKGTSEQVCIGFFKRRIETFPTSKAAEWNAINGNSLSVSFKSISDAVFYTYHCNTGTGKSVAHVRGLLDPSSKLGGMQKAQARAPALLEYVEGFLGLPISKDGQGKETSTGDGTLPFTGPTPNADKLREALKELGYTEKGREISNGGDISIEITNAMIEILKSIKEKHPSYAVKLTGGNDEYHQKLSYNSRHKSGYAMDFVTTPAKNPKDLDNIVLILESFKKKYKPKGAYIDEYRKPSSAATAGHFHIQIN